MTHANKAQEQQAEGNEAAAPRIAARARSLAFDVSGHVVRSPFWRNLSPKVGGRPNVAEGAVPLRGADAWEHAFYLQYEDRKTEFFSAPWRLWSRGDAAARFEAAKALDLGRPRPTTGASARRASAPRSARWSSPRSTAPCDRCCRPLPR